MDRVGSELLLRTEAPIFNLLHQAQTTSPSRNGVLAGQDT